MKLTVLIFSAFLFFSTSTNWLTDIKQAKKEAITSKKLILLNFSGSDWCIPCIKMKSDIFESDVFRGFADKNLVLLKADFPRLKKNKLQLEQLKHNESLAEQYNPKGTFPFTILIDSEGKILKTWEGYVKSTPDNFIKQLEIDNYAR